jgi:uncharacterized protein (DUF1501 family)
MSHLHLVQRRSFLQMLAAGLPQTSVGLSSLAAMGSLSAQTAQDSKFLICLYLQGGNDNANTVIPISAPEYADYKAARPSICLNATDPIPITPDLFNGPSLGLHPKLSYVAQLFNEGKAAIVANVGNLVVPTTKAQWNAGLPSVPVPMQLFSHSDQEAQWQTASPRAQGRTGWLGRTADLLTSTYTDANAKVSMCLSLGPNNIMLNGSKAFAYKMTPTGAARMFGLDGLGQSATASAALKQLYQNTRTHPMENHLSAIYRRSIDAESAVTSALALAPLANNFPNTPIGQQLYGVARMMMASKTLGHRRQVYFVYASGYDFHGGLQFQQAARLEELNAAIQAFCTVIQAKGLWNQSTLFTASDFGRALQTNGRGSDHGWGSHHFVMGGAVRGKRVYGQWPRVALQTPEDAGQGRLIPTTAIDQYASTLANWFGVSSTDMPYVLPNIGNFASSNLGFMT